MAVPWKHFSNNDQALKWDRWQRGDSLHQIT